MTRAYCTLPHTRGHLALDSTCLVIFVVCRIEYRQLPSGYSYVVETSTCVFVLQYRFANEIGMQESTCRAVNGLVVNVASRARADGKIVLELCVHLRPAMLIAGTMYTNHRKGRSIQCGVCKTAFVILRNDKECSSRQEVSVVRVSGDPFDASWIRSLYTVLPHELWSYIG